MGEIIDFPKRSHEMSDIISREKNTLSNEGTLSKDELLTRAREGLQNLNIGQIKFKPYFRVVPNSLQSMNLSRIVSHQKQSVSYLAMEALQNNQLHEFDPERRILIHKYVLLNGFKIGTGQYDAFFKKITNNPDWDITDLKRAIIRLKYEQSGLREV